VQFPFLRNIYDFFAPRTRQITAWSFGFRCGGFEAELLENTGCEMTVFDGRKDAQERFTIFKRVSEQHEKEDTDPEWAEELLDHWFVAKKVSLKESIPFSWSGTLKVNGAETTVSEMDTAIVPQVDLIKIDYPKFECDVLHAVLNAGYRPGLLWVNWTENPDENVKTMLAAGHLQNSGYTLMFVDGNYFVYKFNDQCMYEMCSWATPSHTNPMVETILKSMLSVPKETSSSTMETETETETSS
jgi:hypothetical protein